MKSKINIYTENSEVVIEANAEGLKLLSEVCTKLSNLSEVQSKTPANHYHFSSEMNNAEDGSITAIIMFNNEL